MRPHLTARISKDVIDFPVLSPIQIAGGALKACEGKIIDRSAPDQFGLNNWLLENYHMVGFGTSRDVFALDINYVLKVATSKAGLAQNAVEYHVSSSYSDLPVAHVVYAAQNDLFLMVDRAKQLVPEHFLETYGMEFEAFAEMLEEMYQGGSIYRRQKIYRKLTPQLRTLLASLQRRKISIYDLDRKEQWGDVNETPVIIDYGMNPGAAKDYV
jgi:hypothetical protein